MRPFAPGREIVPGVEVVDHIARSRRQDVYDAWCHRRAARVAVKVLRPDRRGEPRAVAALLREGRLLRRTTHPHVVRAYEVHRDPLAAVVLETLGGRTLDHMVEHDEPLEAEDLRVVTGQLASAVHHLHGLGYLHLDLKPGNVTADRGRVTVLDLSHARRPGRVRAGHGTWCYAAPEQIRGGAVDAAADVWGIAIVLHALATGERTLIDRAEDLDVDDPQLHGPLPSLADARPDLPDDLVGLIDGGLAVDPVDRPPLGHWLGGPPPPVGMT
ncbi:MAG: serine/threonine protein kinase [Solirubrobacteraceae bacterium]|nr:serine/threonine protein kinase [Solirubrobacteraceae bacterium]